MKEFIEYLPFVAPILLIEIILLITALVHVLKHKKYRFGNKFLWIFIVVIFQIVGPVLYFTIGRGEE
jgi:hypothetical protein